MRKITILIVSLLLMAVMVLPANAAGGVSASPSASSVSRGGTFTMSVNLSGMAKTKAASIQVTLGAGLELTGGSSGISGMTVTSNLSEKRFIFYAMSDVDVNGTLAALTLKVKDNASFSAQSISVSVQVGGATYNASTSVTVTCGHSYGAWNNAGSSHTRTCTVCGAADTRAHTYYNGCDRDCNECGATRTTSHNFRTTWSSNWEYHWHECSVCGEWSDDAKHTPGDPATEETPQLCTVCGYEVAPVLEHVHEPVGQWQSDETGHWRACTKCDGKAELAEHSYAAECASTCETCGYVREGASHTPGVEWDGDGTQHWHTCQVCNEKLEAEDHTADLTQEEPVCEVCGLEVEHEHVYAETWNSDEDSHWHECECGAKDLEAEHTWDEGVLTKEPGEGEFGLMTFTCTVCLAETTALAVGSTAQAAQDMLPWWIACGALSAALLASLIFIIIVVVKMSKKPKGKFSVSK